MAKQALILTLLFILDRFKNFKCCNMGIHAATRSQLRERHQGKAGHGSGKVLASASRPPVKLLKAGLDSEVLHEIYSSYYGRNR